jgi:cytochrome P450
MSESSSREDPLSLYRGLIAGKVLQWSPSLGGAWVCGQYRHCLNLLRDPRLISGGASPEETELDRRLADWMVFRDGPEHRRIRRALYPAFTPMAAEAFQQRVSKAVATLVDRFAAAGGGEFIREVAWPLPSLVVADLLGIEESWHQSLLKWTQQIADYLRARPTTPEQTKEANSALSQTQALFRELVERRRSRSADDILSRVAADSTLDAGELSLQCAQLMFGGHETTRNLLAEGVLTLLRHPDDLQALRDDREGLIRSTVEEIARFETPARFVARKAREEMEYGGIRIQAGQNVLVCLGAANRDPARFPDPDRFDIRRTENPHLAFGAGPHICIGSYVARALTQAAISSLLAAFPLLHLRAEPRWTVNPGFSRLARLEIG